MATRIPVSPDADGIIRITCGDVELELEIVSPGASSGAQPVHDVPRDKTKDSYVAYQLAPGFPRDRTKSSYISAVQPGEHAPEIYPDLDRIIGRVSRFGMAEFDLTGGAKPISLEGVADQVARLQSPRDGVGVVHVQAHSLDVHGVHDMMRRLQQTLGEGAPKLFLDLQAGGKKPGDSR